MRAHAHLLRCTLFLWLVAIGLGASPARAQTPSATTYANAVTAVSPALGDIVSADFTATNAQLFNGVNSIATFSNVTVQGAPGGGPQLVFGVYRAEVNGNVTLPQGVVLENLGIGVNGPTSPLIVQLVGLNFFLQSQPGVPNGAFGPGCIGGLVATAIFCTYPTIGGNIFAGLSIANSSVSGSIVNAGTITGATEILNSGTPFFLPGSEPTDGITLNAVTAGGITNSGLISASNGTGIIGIANFVPVGIFLANGSIVNGTVLNSGTLTAVSAINGSVASAFGIEVDGTSRVNGSIVNTGTLSVSATGGNAVGILVQGTVTGGVINTGTILAGEGIVATSSTPLSIFDSGTIIGTSGTAIDLSGNVAGNTLTLGPGFQITGNVIGQGSDTLQLGGSGSGAFNLSNIGTQYTGFTTFNVVSGVWNTTGVFNQTQAWNVLGGTLAGTGTLKSVNVNSGGTLEPGTPGVPGTLTIAGNLAFQSGAVYLVQTTPTTAASTNVAGSATLAGTVQAVLAPGSYAKHNYDILHATGGLGGTTFAGVSFGTPNFSGSLSYSATDVFLNLTTATLGAGTSLNQNQQAVANAINGVFNGGGTLPANVVGIFNLTGASLANALTQLDGEAATGAEHAAFQLTDEFLSLMLDPFVRGRDAAAASGGPALGFAPEAQANLPPELARAYASVFTKAPPATAFEQRWSAWGSAYGGGSTTNGNPTVGSNTLTANTYGFAGGIDYRISPTTVVGVALAGAGSNWGLANALGTGRSDAFQAGAYGVSWFGPTYLAGALSFSNHWFSTNRTAVGDTLTANFEGQSYGARLESGYRYAVQPAFAVTPYAALQLQDFRTPAYTELDVTGGGFGLAYNAMNATDVRSEFGTRFDDRTLLGGKPLILFGRLAWAHDFVGNPSLSAAFQALPGAAFTVNGAPIPHDSAITTAGAQLYLTPQWTFIAKFDGEFAGGSQTYAGTGTLRHTW